jgi:hypothetical protein
MEQPEGIFTKKTFSELVETRVKQDRGTYIDAIVSICQERMTDPEDVAKLLSNPIKAKLEAEGMNLGYLKKTNELPFE